jgi:formylglycine-generating enzyme required for sulfatase activity
MQKENSRETLLDETIIELPAGISRLTSGSNATLNIQDASKLKKNILSTIKNGMVFIPSGNFKFKQTHGDDFISYPPVTDTNIVTMSSFYMDTYPVTNKEFKLFMDQSHYKPSDNYHFLHHWVNGRPLKEDELKPVVNVSYEDALAYATFYGKQLPTEMEWQYAAQTSSQNEWPWIQSKPVTRTYEEVTNTLSVIQIKGIDSTYCNLGNGRLDVVGSYPKGVNPYGLSDLVGSVWQLTHDVYSSGSYKYIIMKGGSYFKPSGSWWYVQGGPRELTYAQYLLRVSPGFERNATVGFRCIFKP